jgi:hypothetical protein
MRNGERETGTYYDCFDALQLSGLRRGCQIAPYTKVLKLVWPLGLYSSGIGGRA